MKKYSYKKIEAKWHKKWDKSDIYKARDFSQKPKYYCLIEFPYPSGAGLHVGHLRSHIAIDIVARYKRMGGFNVLYPIGWDAFGLPTENFAIKTKTHPKIVTKNNIKNFTRQIKSYGPSFDWSREINTTDPKYYKWTQWIFLKLFNSFYDDKLNKAKPIEELKIPKNLDELEKRKFIDDHRMAYEAQMAINWCPSCKIGLANEEVVNGSCERCGTAAEKRTKRQWLLRITKYAERLIRDLNTVDYLEKIKTQQINWIGRSEGAEIEFKIVIAIRQLAEKQSRNITGIATSLSAPRNDKFVKIFTTRLDTIFGCTYMVVAPEHPIIDSLKDQISNYDKVSRYVAEAKNKPDLDRTDLAKEKTGVELKGIKAVNPFNNEEIPIWVADYVLGSYGTGAVMAVPAHDERDFEFAKKYNLPTRQVIAQFFIGEGKDRSREGKKTVERSVVDVIIKHWSEEKFYCLDWNKNNWKSFVIGGIKKGEKKEDVAIREAKEETGYQNMRVVGNIDWEIHSAFFAAHKDENRYAKRNCVYIELVNGEYKEPEPEHVKNHRGVWVNKNEVRNFINLQEVKNHWDAFINGEKSFTEDGKLINSGQFTGMKSDDARGEIIKLAIKNGFGKKAINYKLRDWIFSRQHYWGEPIPIIKCKNCGLKNLKIKAELNFRDNNVWNQIISGKKTIETRALNPEEKNKYFGNIEIGDIVKFNNKNTGDFEVVKINKIYNFRNFDELYSHKDLFLKILPDLNIQNINDLKKAYSFTEDYTERIKKNGLVGWEFEILNVTKNIPLSEKDLPLELPNVKNYEPTDTGESPLANIIKWVEVKCPVCGEMAKRETDTMPNWAGSSWYYLAYLMQGISNFQFPISKYRRAFDYWMPVDLYNGGMEHTTLHLLYSRFWHKFLYDLGYVNVAEPYKMRRSHGMILAEDGQKMSKSRGNVVNPDEVIEKYGADTIRLYEMFMGPYGEAIPWNTASLVGMSRFLERVWNLQFKAGSQDPVFLQNKSNIILVATNNPGKLAELRDHLKKFKIIGLKDVKKKIKEPAENGKTFAENSLIKAKYYAQKTGYLTIADDSGLCVKALGGRPGVYSSRWAEGDYKKAHQKLLKELGDAKDRTAFFQSVVTFYNPKNDKYEQFEGICDGEILPQPRGTEGFGYDPLFMPKGFDKSFGECSPEEKYRFDHRKKAVDKLNAHLDNKTGKSQDKELESLVHRTIKKVTEDIESLKFNTAISALMVLLNEMSTYGGSAEGGEKNNLSIIHYSKFLILLSPFAPHIAEELWQSLGNKKSIHIQSWPKFDPELARENEIELVVQINGKVRDQIKVPAGISKEEAKKIAFGSEKVKKWIAGKSIRKFIFARGRLVNIVI